MWVPDEAISLNAWVNTVGLIATVRLHLCDMQPPACADGGPNLAIHLLICPHYPRYLYPSLKCFTYFPMHQPLSLFFLRRARITLYFCIWALLSNAQHTQQAHLQHHFGTPTSIHQWASLWILYVPQIQNEPGLFGIFNVLDRTIHRTKQKTIGPSPYEQRLRKFEPITTSHIRFFIQELTKASKAS